MLVVLVGLPGAGKSTLLNRLREEDGIAILQPSTTRPPRDENDEEYDFPQRWQSNRFAWDIEVRGHHYGLRRSELDKAGDDLCVTVFDPLNIDVLIDFRASSDIRIITIGLDTIPDIETQAARVNHDQPRVLSQIQFERGRTAVQRCDTVLSGTTDSLVQAVHAIARVVESRGGMLIKQDIEPLISAGALLSDAALDQVRSASYDLRLGPQIWCKGQLHELTPTNPTFEIPPYSYAIVTARETANFPTFVTGAFDIKVSLFLSGVILSNGPQIDPGYRGQLFCMLFNCNGIGHRIVKDRHFATIEFNTTTRPTDPYRQHYQLQRRLEQIMGEGALGGPGGNIIDSLGARIEGVQRDVTDIHRSNRNTIIALGAAMIAVVAIPATWALTILWDRVKGAEEIVTRMKDTQQQIVGAVRTEGDKQQLEIQQIVGGVRAEGDKQQLELQRIVEEARRFLVPAPSSTPVPAPLQQPNRTAPP